MSLDIDVNADDTTICFSALILPNKEQIFNLDFNTLKENNINLKLNREYAEITSFNGHVPETKTIVYKSFEANKAEWRKFCISLEDFVLRCDTHILVPKGNVKPSPDALKIILRNGNFMRTCDNGLPKWHINGTQVTVWQIEPDTCVEYIINSRNDFVPTFTIASYDITIERNENEIYASMNKEGPKETTMLKKDNEYNFQIHFQKLNNGFEIEVLHEERRLFLTKVPQNNLLLGVAAAHGSFFDLRQDIFQKKINEIENKNGISGWMCLTIGAIAGLICISIPINLFVALYTRTQLSKVKYDANKIEDVSDAEDFDDQEEDLGNRSRPKPGTGSQMVAHGRNYLRPISMQIIHAGLSYVQTRRAQLH